MTFCTTHKPLPPEILADALEPPPREPDRIICATPLERKRRMTEKKYQPTNDEPRFMSEQWWTDDGDGGWLAFYSKPPSTWGTREEAEAEVQRVALAIADRVHGAELAALRAALHELVDAVTRACDEGTRVGDALVAAEAVLEGESDHGS